MYNLTQFKNEIIAPSLKDINSYTAESTELLVMIAAHESGFGTYVRQVGGPALGPFQCEPATYDALWHWLETPGRDVLTKRLLNSNGLSSKPLAETMMFNLRLATQMARVFFLRFKEPIPDALDVDGLAKYAKKYWNTSLGKATVQDYESAYFFVTKGKK